MNNYIFFGIIGILIIIYLLINIESFTQSDIFVRKSKNLDLLENDTYMNQYPNDIVNIDTVNIYKYNGPKWKNEFDYNNPEILEMERNRNQLLHFIKSFDGNYKTFVNCNNTTYCGGHANRCNASIDCCGGSSCIDGKCSF